jgi:hypothetical protein
MSRKKSKYRQFKKAKSDIAANLVGELTFDSENRVKSVIVPGSDAKQYKVILRRYIDNEGIPSISGECLLLCNGNNTQRCKGNSIAKTSIPCVHTETAAKFALHRAGFSFAICDSRDDADLMLRIKKESMLYKLVSHQSKIEKAEYILVDH